MARKKRSTKKQETEIQDYRHDDRHTKEQPTRGHRLTWESPRTTEAGVRLQPPPAAESTIRRKRRRRPTPRTAPKGTAASTLRR